MIELVNLKIYQQFKVTIIYSDHTIFYNKKFENIIGPMKSVNWFSENVWLSFVKILFNTNEF